MKLSLQVSGVISSLDVLASNDFPPGRVHTHAKSRGIKFDEHDPIHIVMARLAKDLSETLESIADQLRYEEF